MKDPKVVPRDATNEQVIDIARHWIDVLARGDYEGVFAALGYVLAYGESGAVAMREAVQSYRWESSFPGVTEFAVTSWKTATGGNPSPRLEVVRYVPLSHALRGAVSVDLPLNGQWSDLTADFVWFESAEPGDDYTLVLEEIGSLRHAQKDAP
jgi:hypothetical protein